MSINVDECWLWAGTVQKNGYGRKGPVLAHRLMLSQYEELIDGLEVDHLCNTRQCVNPKHMEQVTRQENLRRARKDFCVNGHPKDEERSYWYIDKNGHNVRRCRDCNHQYKKNRLNRAKGIV